MILLALVWAFFGGDRPKVSMHSTSSPLPSIFPPGRGPLEISEDVVAFVPGASYLVKLSFAGLWGALSTASGVHAKLAELGFQPARVWSSDPPDMFPDRERSEKGATYWAAGMYAGAPQTARRPTEFVRLWRIRPLAVEDVAPAALRESAWEKGLTTVTARLLELQHVAYLVRQEIAMLQGPVPEETLDTSEEAVMTAPERIPARLVNGRAKAAAKAAEKAAETLGPSDP